jgi:branched-chain amino acid transport system ATP-binding protein
VSASVAVGAGLQPLLALNNVEVLYDNVALAVKGVSIEVARGGRGLARGQRRRQEARS